MKDKIFIYNATNICFQLTISFPLLFKNSLLKPSQFLELLTMAPTHVMDFEEYIYEGLETFIDYPNNQLTENQMQSLTDQMFKLSDISPYVLETLENEILGVNKNSIIRLADCYENNNNVYLYCLKIEEE